MGRTLAPAPKFKATFTLKNLNNKIMGSLTARGKAFHKKRKAALKIANQKIKIDKQEFYELISKLDTKEK